MNTLDINEEERNIFEYLYEYSSEEKIEAYKKLIEIERYRILIDKQQLNESNAK